MNAGDAGDDKAVFGKGVQDSMRIFEKFEGFVASVEDGHNDFQVPQSVDLDVGDRSHNAQAGSRTGGGGKSDENNESGTEGGEHGNVGSQETGQLDES